MPNLLPEEEKKKLFNDYARRIASVSLISLILAVITATILLFPSYYLSRSKLEEEKNNLAALEQSLGYRENRNIEEELVMVTAMIDELGPYLEERSAEQDIKAATGVLPASVSVKSISWRRLKADESEIIISGVAQNRDSLLSFSKRLEEIDRFSKIDLPIASLAKETNVSFAVTITAEAQE